MNNDVNNVIINLVENTEENGKLIMEWRNNIITRNMSHNSDLKKWGDFKEEFTNKYFNNYIQPLFAYYNNEKIAFIGCVSNNENDKETSKEICKIGINISPQYRGKKLGKIILNNTIAYIKKNFPLTKKIIAEIKTINIISCKLFESCNFKFIDLKKNTENIYVYHYDI